MAKVKITLTRSLIQRRTIQALGLRKLNSTVEHEDTPAIKGMLHKVEHLITVEKISE